MLKAGNGHINIFLRVNFLFAVWHSEGECGETSSMSFRENDGSESEETH